MKILVLSDSHSTLRIMRQYIEAIQPELMIHLGDYYDDAGAMAEEYPDIRMMRVPGNCDEYRCPPFAPRILIRKIDGVTFYMTHGHEHQVKQTLSFLTRDARASGASAVLFGHTHVPDCRQEDGLWILNPGTCGYGGGTAGLIETDHGIIKSCRILRQEDLEDAK